MGILDNDTVIVDAILTKIGRQKLAQGQPLGISQYSFGDTGVDYTLYNADHPSGSSAYGSAITNLPMLEAVPDDNVFLRFKLWGNENTERNIQDFSFLTITSGTSVTISKIAGAMGSVPITIIPKQFPGDNAKIFDYKILDIRGLEIVAPENVTINMGDYTGEGTPPFSHPDPVVANINGVGDLTINAKSSGTSAVSTQRSIGIEITKDETAPAFVTVTIEKNDFI